MFYPSFTGAILHPRTEFSGRNTDIIDGSLCVLVLGIAYLATIWPPERDYCLDRGGQWNEEAQICVF